MGNLFDFVPEKHALALDKLTALDQWALSQASACAVAVTEAMERYEFHVAMRELTQFCNVTLSAQYIDATKDTLYCEAAGSAKRRSAQTAMCWIADLLTNRHRFAQFDQLGQILF